MMGINFMWWSRVGHALLLITLAHSSAHAASWICPQTLSPGRVTHTLDNASLFDGPPADLADLIPVPAGAYDEWNLQSVDPFLVCRYKGTVKTITIHANGASRCVAGGKSFQAYCTK
jgi:hypothetical protein